MTIKFFAALLGATLLISTSAQAALVNHFSNSVLLEDFEDLGFVSSGPVVLANGQVTATSNVLATYDYLPVDLGSNGTWGLDGFVGIGDYYHFSTTPSATDSLTFNLTTGLSSIGAQYSIFKDDMTIGELLLEALSVDGSVLESSVITIDFQAPDSYNWSAFYGFSRASNDIFGLRITGDGFVLDDLATDATTVPVTATLPLLASGLVFFGLVRRRKNALK